VQLIFNADDFGGSTDINEAVLLAHTQGVLTSASWMATGPAAEQAVELARANPGLAVGLHLVLVKGRPALPPQQVPHLINEDGRFPDDPLQAGLRLVASPAARRELQAELRAQFERFAASGLALDHVDSHLHYHVHPAVFPRVVKLAAEFSAGGLRLPRDDLVLAWSGRAVEKAGKILLSLIFALFYLLYRPSARRRGLFVPARTFGLLNSGRMEEAYVLNILARGRVDSAEVYFHPATRPGGEPLGPNPGDLAVLLGGPLREALRRRGIRLATYSSLARGNHAG
jgi:hopanoid biosynthesis associated protein HpnK